MKNKIIQLVISTLLLIVIVISVNIYRDTRKNLKPLDNSLIETQNTPENKNISNNHIVPKKEIRKAINKNTPEEENIYSYVNVTFANLNDIEVFVSIVNEEGIISAYLTSKIAEVYSQLGYIGKTGLFKNSFYKTKYYDDLLNGNINTIKKLNLNSHTDYLAIGTISYEKQKGLLVEGTVICTAVLNISIISSKQNSIVRSFSFSAKGNGTSDNQAIEHANNKLIDIYYSSYSSFE